MSRTVFEKIWDGDLPAYELYRYHDLPTGIGYMAILDVHPATPGHTMVIPRRPARSWLELSLPEHQQASTLQWYVAKRQEEVLGVKNVTPANFGDQVPHVHYHGMPSFTQGDTIRRMHPDSARMADPIDHGTLADMQRKLAFPPELASEVDARLAELGAMAVHLG